MKTFLMVCVGMIGLSVFAFGSDDVVNCQVTNENPGDRLELNVTQQMVTFIPVQGAAEVVVGPEVVNGAARPLSGCNPQVAHDTTKNSYTLTYDCGPYSAPVEYDSENGSLAIGLFHPNSGGFTIFTNQGTSTSTSMRYFELANCASRN